MAMDQRCCEREENLNYHALEGCANLICLIENSSARASQSYEQLIYNFGDLMGRMEESLGGNKSQFQAITKSTVNDIRLKQLLGTPEMHNRIRESDI
jgi:hypothetical protein